MCARDFLLVSSGSYIGNNCHIFCFIFFKTVAVKHIRLRDFCEIILFDSATLLNILSSILVCLNCSLCFCRDLSWHSNMLSYWHNIFFGCGSRLVRDLRCVLKRLQKIGRNSLRIDWVKQKIHLCIRLQFEFGSLFINNRLITKSLLSIQFHPNYYWKYYQVMAIPLAN